VLKSFRSSATVYDGYSSRKVGNSHLKAFHSRFNYLAGMTPDIEKSWSLNTLGERFLMYRICIESRRDHARKALDAVRKKSRGKGQARPELQRAVKEFLDNLERFVPEVDDEMAERIIDLAEILSTCRTYVHRERNDDMPCLPVAEMASRVAKQLLRIGMSVALVRGRRQVGGDELDVMKRVALDSLPTNRRLLLTALHECPPGGSWPLAAFAAKVSRVSKTTVSRELENLAELGAVKRTKQQVASGEAKKTGTGLLTNYKTSKCMYCLTDKFRSYCQNVGGI
jgi:hypothetical protein